MSERDLWTNVEEAAAWLGPRLESVPEVGVVLGSGLGAFVDGVEGVRAFGYAEVPHMPRSSVAGHAGRLCFGTRAGRSLCVMQGRVHLYEGHSAARVVFGVRLMWKLGARVLLLTNAAGGIGEGFTPGSLACIVDHLNLTGRSCLEGPADTRVGPRFPDMTRAYDPELIELAQRKAAARGIALVRGVYAGVLGPSYETPAEVRMLRALGAQLVGMSTVQEVIAARHLGMRVLGLSCVTNVAAGLSPGALLDHGDVQREAGRAAGRLCTLLGDVLSALPVEEESPVGG